jgi:epoxide hydrolase-like predicted phosphatase
VSTPVKAVISDFGGVLTSPLMSFFARFQDDSGVPLEALGRAMARIASEQGFHPLFELEKGKLPEARFVQLLEGAVREELGRPVRLHGLADAYWSDMDTNDAMVDYLRGLRDDGVRLALLTNNVREWEPRWRSMVPIDELFEVVVDSAFVGMRKPDAEIYELTLERLGLDGPECAFVDDIEVNCHAAERLGMRAVWFRDTDQAIAELDAAVGR